MTWVLHVMTAGHHWGYPGGGLDSQEGEGEWQNLRPRPPPHLRQGGREPGHLRQQNGEQGGDGVAPQHVALAGDEDGLQVLVQAVQLQLQEGEMIDMKLSVCRYWIMNHLQTTELQKYLLEFDVDNDGLLDFEEFKLAIKFANDKMKEAKHRDKWDCVSCCDASWHVTHVTLTRDTRNNISWTVERQMLLSVDW